MPRYYCSSCSGWVGGPNLKRCPHCTSFFGWEGSASVREELSLEEIKERAENYAAYARSPEGLAEAKERAQKQVESDTWNTLNSNLGWLSVALSIAAIICWVYGYRNFVSGYAALWCLIVIVSSILVSIGLIVKTLDFRSSWHSGSGVDSFLIFVLTLPALLMLYLYITHFVPNLKTSKLEWLSPFSDAPVTTSNVLLKNDSEKGMPERQQTSTPPVEVVVAEAKPLPEAPASLALVEKKEIIIVREAVRNRDYSYTLTVDRVDYNQKGMNFIIAGDAGAATANFIIENKDKRILVTYVMADGCPFCIYKAELADKVEPIPIAKAGTTANKPYEFKYNMTDTDGVKYTLHYDSSSLRKTGDIFEINVIVNFESGDKKLKNGVSYKSIVHNRVYNCLDNTSATKTSTWYSETMGKGDIVNVNDPRNLQFTVTPEKSANARFIKESNYCN